MHGPPVADGTSPDNPTRRGQRIGGRIRANATLGTGTYRIDSLTPHRYVIQQGVGFAGPHSRRHADAMN